PVIYALSLHDALPISGGSEFFHSAGRGAGCRAAQRAGAPARLAGQGRHSAAGHRRQVPGRLDDRRPAGDLAPGGQPRAPAAGRGSNQTERGEAAMMYDVRPLAAAINVAPATEIDEILQNVAVILSTVRYTVPYDRRFGLNPQYLDDPLPVTRARAT